MADLPLPGAADSDNEDQFAVSAELVEQPTLKAAGTSSLDFDGLLSPPLVLHEDLTKGNGGQAWPAGMILARYLLRTKREEMKTAKGIVELGAGGGLCGLAVAIGCSPQSVVHTTDQDTMQALMHRNIALNDLTDRVKPAIYSWGEPRPADVPAHPDVILAAECVYFEPAFPLLQTTLLELVGPNTTVYFCFKRRRRADLNFMKAIKKVLLVEDIKDDPDREQYARENIIFCTLRRKKEKTQNGKTVAST